MTCVRDCLICCSEVCSEGANPHYPDLVANNPPSTELSNNLHTIFILRNLFEVPRERLQEYLHHSEGRGPSEWELPLCSRCKETVENVERIYQEMIKATRLFKQAKQEVIKIVIGSTEFGRSGVERQRENLVNSKVHHLRKVIVEETRAFICRHDYEQSTNPFKSGDVLAQNLLLERLKRQQKQQGSNNLKTRIESSSAVNSNHFSFQMLHLWQDESGSKRYRCRICSLGFSHLSKLKFHTIRLHIEQLLEASRLPGISDLKFQSCCKSLIENITSTTPEQEHRTTMESKLVISCSHCGKGFTDKRYLHCHWIQHHFEVLCVKLQVLQNSEEAGTGVIQEALSANQCGGGGETSKKLTLTLQCSQCNKPFIGAGELRTHAVMCHPEHFFPAFKYNLVNTSPEMYKVICRNLFNHEKYKTVGNESIGCPFCPKIFTGKRYVKVHMLESHYDIMAGKLIQLLKVSQVPTLTSFNTNHQTAPPTINLVPVPPDYQRKPLFNCKFCGLTFTDPAIFNQHQNHCPQQRSLIRVEHLHPQSSTAAFNHSIFPGRTAESVHAQIIIPQHHLNIGNSIQSTGPTTSDQHWTQSNVDVKVENNELQVVTFADDEDCGNDSLHENTIVEDPLAM